MREWHLKADRNVEDPRRLTIATVLPIIDIAASEMSFHVVSTADGDMFITASRHEPISESGQRPRSLQFLSIAYQHLASGRESIAW